MLPKSNYEQWLTAIPKKLFDQQLTVGWWYPWDVDLKVGEIMVRKLCADLQPDG